MRDLCVCVCTGGNVCLYEYAKKRVQGKRQTKRMGSQMANNFIGRTHTHTHTNTHTHTHTVTHTHTHTHTSPVAVAFRGMAYVLAWGGKSATARLYKHSH